MKIAVSAHQKEPNAGFSSRFARCAFFLVYDTGNEQWVALDNPAGNSRGGAGPRAVEHLAAQGVSTVISGRYGPQAFQALQEAGIDSFTAGEGSPLQLIERWKEGALEQGTAAKSSDH